MVVGFKYGVVVVEFVIIVVIKFGVVVVFVEIFIE